MRKINSEVMAGPALDGFIETFISHCKGYGVAPNGQMITEFVHTLAFEKNVALAFRYTDERIKLIAQKMTGN